jgi:hypothetical protein
MSLANNGLSIEALFYSRFEDIEGYTVVASDPANVLGEAQFKEIGYHFLPDKSLSSGHVITLFLDRYRIIGCPVHLSGPQYSRSAFVFCIGFIINGADDMSIYRRLAKQLSVGFEQLEVDMRFLSDISHVDQVLSLLTEIRQQLNNPRLPYVYVPISDRYALTFKPVYLHSRLPIDSPTSASPSSVFPEYFVIHRLLSSSPIPRADDRLMRAVFDAKDVESVATMVHLFPGENVQYVLKLLHASRHFLVIPPLAADSRPALTPKAKLLLATNVGERQDFVDFAQTTSVHDVLRVLSLMDGRRSLADIVEASGGVTESQVTAIIVLGIAKEVVRVRKLFLVANKHGNKAFMDVKLVSVCDGNTDALEAAFKLGISVPELVGFADTHKFAKIWV